MKTKGMLDLLAKVEHKTERNCEQRQCPHCLRWYFHGEFGKGWKAAGIKEPVNNILKP
jgi:hypothetical protein